ncbi:MAG: apolipoprotein N-acyltransferase, partial [Campylobacterota bacterium]|nr:apolipoprotein N-acyltransferase [Campylobacterota bacterium]
MNKIIKNILLALLTSALFSGFIYFEEYSLTNKFINTLFGLSALALLLYIPKHSILISGFFIGLLWFYWIGYSFEYQDVGYMTPIITVGFGFIYMLFFGVLAVTNRVYLRAILLFILSFIEPFDFNWLQIELLFVDSYIGIFKYQLAIILVALTLPSLLKNRFKFTPLLLLVLAINFSAPTEKPMPLKIKLVATDI